MNEMLNMTRLNFNFFIDNFDRKEWATNFTIISRYETKLLYLSEKANSIVYRETMHSKESDFLFFQNIFNPLVISVFVWIIKWILIPYLFFIILKFLFKRYFCFKSK